MHQQNHPGHSVPDDRTTVTFYLDLELRARARAAYEHTRVVETDDSWSHMIGKALTAEVGRREALYNQSHRFVADDRRLPPGRPVR